MKLPLILICTILLTPWVHSVHHKLTDQEAQRLEQNNNSHQNDGYFLNLVAHKLNRMGDVFNHFRKKVQVFQIVKNFDFGPAVALLQRALTLAGKTANIFNQILPNKPSSIETNEIEDNIGTNDGGIHINLPVTDEELTLVNEGHHNEILTQKPLIISTEANITSTPKEDNTTLALENFFKDIQDNSTTAKMETSTTESIQTNKTSNEVITKRETTMTNDANNFELKSKLEENAFEKESVKEASKEERELEELSQKYDMNIDVLRQLSHLYKPQNLEKNKRSKRHLISTLEPRKNHANVDFANDQPVDGNDGHEEERTVVKIPNDTHRFSDYYNTAPRLFPEGRRSTKIKRSLFQRFPLMNTLRRFQQNQNRRNYNYNRLNEGYRREQEYIQNKINENSYNHRYFNPFTTYENDQRLHEQYGVSTEDQAFFDKPKLSDEYGPPPKILNFRSQATFKPTTISTKYGVPNKIMTIYGDPNQNIPEDNLDKIKPNQEYGLPQNIENKNIILLSRNKIPFKNYGVPFEQTSREDIIDNSKIIDAKVPLEGMLEHKDINIIKTKNILSLNGLPEVRQNVDKMRISKTYTIPKQTVASKYIEVSNEESKNEESNNEENNNEESKNEELYILSQINKNYGVPEKDKTLAKLSEEKIFHHYEIPGEQRNEDVLDKIPVVKEYNLPENFKNSRLLSHINNKDILHKSPIREAKNEGNIQFNLEYGAPQNTKKIEDAFTPKAKDTMSHFNLEDKERNTQSIPVIFGAQTNAPFVRYGLPLEENKTVEPKDGSKIKLDDSTNDKNKDSYKEISHKYGFRVEDNSKEIWHKENKPSEYGVPLEHTKIEYILDIDTKTPSNKYGLPHEEKINSKIIDGSTLKLDDGILKNSKEQEGFSKPLFHEEIYQSYGLPQELGSKENVYKTKLNEEKINYEINLGGKKEENKSRSSMFMEYVNKSNENKISNIETTTTDKPKHFEFGFKEIIDADTLQFITEASVTEETISPLLNAVDAEKNDTIHRWVGEVFNKFSSKYKNNNVEQQFVKENNLEETYGLPKTDENIVETHSKNNENLQSANDQNIIFNQNDLKEIIDVHNLPVHNEETTKILEEHNHNKLEKYDQNKNDYLFPMLQYGLPHGPQNIQKNDQNYQRREEFPKKDLYLLSIVQDFQPNSEQKNVREDLDKQRFYLQKDPQNQQEVLQKIDSSSTKEKDVTINEANFKDDLYSRYYKNLKYIGNTPNKNWQNFQLAPNFRNKRDLSSRFPLLHTLKDFQGDKNADYNLANRIITNDLSNQNMFVNENLNTHQPLDCVQNSDGQSIKHPNPKYETTKQDYIPMDLVKTYGLPTSTKKEENIEKPSGFHGSYDRDVDTNPFLTYGLPKINSTTNKEQTYKEEGSDINNVKDSNDYIWTQESLYNYQPHSNHQGEGAFHYDFQDDTQEINEQNNRLLAILSSKLVKQEPDKSHSSSTKTIEDSLSRKRNAQQASNQKTSDADLYRRYLKNLAYNGDIPQQNWQNSQVKFRGKRDLSSFFPLLHTLRNFQNRQTFVQENVEPQNGNPQFEVFQGHPQFEVSKGHPQFGASEGHPQFELYDEEEDDVNTTEDNHQYSDGNQFSSDHNRTHNDYQHNDKPEIERLREDPDAPTPEIDENVDLTKVYQSYYKNLLYEGDIPSKNWQIFQNTNKFRQKRSVFLQPNLAIDFFRPIVVKNYQEYNPPLAENNDGLHFNNFLPNLYNPSGFLLYKQMNADKSDYTDIEKLFQPKNVLDQTVNFYGGASFKRVKTKEENNHKEDGKEYQDNGSKNEAEQSNIVTLNRSLLDGIIQKHLQKLTGRSEEIVDVPTSYDGHLEDTDISDKISSFVQNFGGSTLAQNLDDNVNNEEIFTERSNPNITDLLQAFLIQFESFQTQLKANLSEHFLKNDSTIIIEHPNISSQLLEEEIIESLHGTKNNNKYKNNVENNDEHRLENIVVSPLEYIKQQKKQKTEAQNIIIENNTYVDNSTKNQTYNNNLNNYEQNNSHIKINKKSNNANIEDKNYLKPIKLIFKGNKNKVQTIFKNDFKELEHIPKSLQVHEYRSDISLEENDNFTKPKLFEKTQGKLKLSLKTDDKNNKNIKQDDQNNKNFIQPNYFRRKLLMVTARPSMDFREESEEETTPIICNTSTATDEIEEKLTIPTTTTISSEDSTKKAPPPLDWEITKLIYLMSGEELTYSQLEQVGDWIIKENFDRQLGRDGIKVMAELKKRLEGKNDTFYLIRDELIEQGVQNVDKALEDLYEEFFSDEDDFHNAFLEAFKDNLLFNIYAFREENEYNKKGVYEEVDAATLDERAWQKSLLQEMLNQSNLSKNKETVTEPYVFEPTLKKYTDCEDEETATEQQQELSGRKDGSKFLYVPTPSNKEEEETTVPLSDYNRAEQLTTLVFNSRYTKANMPSSTAQTNEVEQKMNLKEMPTLDLFKGDAAQRENKRKRTKRQSFSKMLDDSNNFKQMNIYDLFLEKLLYYIDNSTSNGHNSNNQKYRYKIKRHIDSDADVTSAKNASEKTNEFFWERYGKAKTFILDKFFERQKYERLNDVYNVKYAKEHTMYEIPRFEENSDKKNVLKSTTNKNIPSVKVTKNYDSKKEHDIKDDEHFKLVNEVLDKMMKMFSMFEEKFGNETRFANTSDNQVENFDIKTTMPKIEVSTVKNVTNLLEESTFNPKDNVGKQNVDKDFIKEAKIKSFFASMLAKTQNKKKDEKNFDVFQIINKNISKQNEEALTKDEVNATKPTKGFEQNPNDSTTQLNKTVTMINEDSVSEEYSKSPVDLNQDKPSKVYTTKEEDFEEFIETTTNLFSTIIDEDKIFESYHKLNLEDSLTASTEESTTHIRYDSEEETKRNESKDFFHEITTTEETRNLKTFGESSFDATDISEKIQTTTPLFEINEAIIGLLSEKINSNQPQKEEIRENILDSTTLLSTKEGFDFLEKLTTETSKDMEFLPITTPPVDKIEESSTKDATKDIKFPPITTSHVDTNEETSTNDDIHFLGELTTQTSKDIEFLPLTTPPVNKNEESSTKDASNDVEFLPITTPHVGENEESITKDDLDYLEGWTTKESGGIVFMRTTTPPIDKHEEVEASLKEMNSKQLKIDGILENILIPTTLSKTNEDFDYLKEATTKNIEFSTEVLEDNITIFTNEQEVTTQVDVNELTGGTTPDYINELTVSTIKDEQPETFNELINQSDSLVSPEESFNDTKTLETSFSGDTNESKLSSKNKLETTTVKEEMTSLNEDVFENIGYDQTFIELSTEEENITILPLKQGQTKDIFEDQTMKESSKISADQEAYFITSTTGLEFITMDFVETTTSSFEEATNFAGKTNFSEGNNISEPTKIIIMKIDEENTEASLPPNLTPTLNIESSIINEDKSSEKSKRQIDMEISSEKTISIYPEDKSIMENGESIMIVTPIQSDTLNKNLNFPQHALNLGMNGKLKVGYVDSKVEERHNSDADVQVIYSTNNFKDQLSDMDNSGALENIENRHTKEKSAASKREIIEELNLKRLDKIKSYSSPIVEDSTTRKSEVYVPTIPSITTIETPPKRRKKLKYIIRRKIKKTQ